MDTALVSNNRLRGGEKVPALKLPLVGGGTWSLDRAVPRTFTLIWVIRGVHCSFCKAEVEALAARRQELAGIGCEVVVASMDDAARAARLADEWRAGGLTVTYGLSEAAARAWGLYLSSRVKDAEPAIFAEPGLFLVRPDGTLYAQFQSTAPWLRVDTDTLLRGVKIALERGTPPRGRY